MQWVKLRLSRTAFVSAEVFRIAIKQQWTVKEKKNIVEWKTAALA